MRNHAAQPQQSLLFKKGTKEIGKRNKVKGDDDICVCGVHKLQRTVMWEKKSQLQHSS